MDEQTQKDMMAVGGVSMIPLAIIVLSLVFSVCVCCASVIAGFVLVA